MSASPSKLQHYSTSPVYCVTPSPLQALGEVIGQDGQTLFSIAFTTHRDIITQIGYTPSGKGSGHHGRGAFRSRSDRGKAL